MTNKWIVFMIIMSTATLTAQMQNRDSIEDKYKWDLSHIYASLDDWHKEKDALIALAPAMKKYKGKLTQSPTLLAEALEQMTEGRRIYVKLYSYAGMSSDVDTRNAKNLALKQEIAQLNSVLSSEIAFVQPELLASDQDMLLKWADTEPTLAPFAFYLKDLVKKKDHIGTEDVEKVLAQTSLISGASSAIFSTFYNADFPFPAIEIDGKEVVLNSANFSLYRASDDRDIRRRVFEAFMGKLAEFQRTFGVQLYNNLNKDVFYARVRNYNSTLESALGPNNIPVDVYHNLVSSVNENMGTFHRYLQLRKRLLGIDQLNYYDLYAPLVGEVELEYSVEEAMDHILRSLDPLGAEYVQVVDRSFNERWIDMYPNTGKRSGAYSNGSAYDVHPYILMNYNGKYNDVSTLTHELGHTMHSYLTNKKQHFAQSGYSIFVAEVASTVNEELLNDYFLKQIKDDKVKLSILGNYLEGAKGTLFRQTQFAEFELKIHELVEKGQALTGEDFDRIYLEITRKYYGHDQGVCIVDENIRSEWSYIPHFYYNYYVYQYATSYTASQALSDKLIERDPEAIERYLNFLSSGSTKYPVDLLIDAGVDMNTSEPFQITMKKLNIAMDEMEQILDRMGK